MANHKSDINVGIKFNADTSQAQQQIQALCHLQNSRMLLKILPVYVIFTILTLLLL